LLGLAGRKVVRGREREKKTGEEEEPIYAGTSCLRWSEGPVFLFLFSRPTEESFPADLKVRKANTAKRMWRST